MNFPIRRPRRELNEDDARQGRVLIVDADGDARARLRSLLGGEGYAAEAFAWAGALLDAPLPEAPCCIIANVEMPEGFELPDGFELIERLKNRGEPIPVIFLSNHADVRLSVRAIKAGASDFLPRPFDEHDLICAVEHALETDAERRSKARRQQTVARRFDTLTQRERQVMEGVVRGLMNKQIAWELKISEITVKLHRSSVMRKMDLRSVPDLVRASLALCA